MNNCLCESCCNKDYCLNYQDYKNPDGLITEPIIKCGRYKNYMLLKIYTKDEVIAMLADLQLEIEDYCRDQYDEGEYPAEGMISNIVQKKINSLKEK